MHRAKTGPLLTSFFDWAGKVVTRLSAKSELAEAFRYTLKRQCALSRFLTDARLDIDNNIAENAMRGIAVWQTTVDEEAARAKREHPDNLDKRDLMLAALASPLVSGCTKCCEFPRSVQLLLLHLI
jgi:hypothetical protein